MSLVKKKKLKRQIIISIICFIPVFHDNSVVSVS